MQGETVTSPATGATSGVTNRVTHMVYSHHHADHLGAASLFGGDIVRIGHEETRRMQVLDSVIRSRVRAADTPGMPRNPAAISSAESAAPQVAFICCSSWIRLPDASGG
jgi:glyoxylase-like metal-dependent hydrolase (beta-lactamase superfamily II)